MMPTYYKAGREPPIVYDGAELFATYDGSTFKFYVTTDDSLIDSFSVEGLSSTDAQEIAQDIAEQIQEEL